MAKYVFVTGGVTSSLGKGITAASIGRLLKARGSRRLHPQARPVHQRRPGDDVAVPARRGLRHRRRRRDGPRPGPLRAVHRREPDASSATSRPAASTRRSSPRSAAATTSAAPSRSSRTSPTRSRSGSSGWPATGGPDVVIVEVGGTVGDIESLPFLEAIRQMRKDVGAAERPLRPRDAAAGAAGHRRAQDQADAALGQGAARDRHPARRHRPALATTRSATRSARRSPSSPTSPAEAVIPAETAETIYEVPLLFEEAGLGDLVVRDLAPGRRRRAARPRPPGPSWSS